eukprot:gnl/MRDRNA2_/MRDRNA2_143946_c0_seq1.p1 gnl/MRDRNA2_/MRDRNA2_143946_c0~~gnl/MRDRNA2_/MRDRNA2_143946_c0_seq1.p1  ORF type:complete len:788 (+),score=136.48 gnl/MRDRNA2_/MRDRNA2_143946_c0_seq1:2-2365(+)
MGAVPGKVAKRKKPITFSEIHVSRSTVSPSSHRLRNNVAKESELLRPDVDPDSVFRTMPDPNNWTKMQIFPEEDPGFQNCMVLADRPAENVIRRDAQFRQSAQDLRIPSASSVSTISLRSLQSDSAESMNTSADDVEEVASEAQAVRTQMQHGGGSSGCDSKRLSSETHAAQTQSGKDLWKTACTKIKATQSFLLARGSQVVDMIKDHNTGDHYDVIVLGAGPAGMKVATECANWGFRICLIDPREVITGAPTGLHSKCLREAALQGAKTWSEVAVIINKVISRARESTAQLLESFHIEMLQGFGSFIDHETILFSPVEGRARTLKADCVVIATGSCARRHKVIPFHLPGVFDSDTIHHISYIPKNLVVQGAGYIGLEYALIFSLLGSKVIVVNRSNNFVQMMDKALQHALLERLKIQKVEVRLNTAIKGVRSALPEECGSTSPALLVETASSVLVCDCLLSAIGRDGVSDGYGLEKLKHLGMQIGHRKMIQVDEFQHTSVDNIYAVGDVADGGFATVGQAQAMRAMQKHFGKQGKGEKAGTVKPCAVWTIPEIAWAGINEQTAVKKRIDFGTTCAEYKETFRGLVNGSDSGFLKLIFDSRDGKVLGVHICGENASDLINYAVDVVNQATVYDILDFVFPTMTYHEVYQIAAHKAKIQLRGVKSASAETIWNRLNIALTKKIKNENPEMNTQEAHLQALFAAFQTFDKDKSGTLNVEELKDALGMLGLDIPMKAVEEMVAEIDENGDGELDFEELCQILTGRGCGHARQPESKSSASQGAEETEVLV